MQTPEISALINSVLSGKMDFKTLEKEIFKFQITTMAQMLIAVLEEIDRRILYSAQREGWEVVSTLEKTIVTSFGEITFKRRYYKKRTASGAIAYIFMLDYILKIPEKNISPRLEEIMVSLAADESYRKSAEKLEEMLGIKISHETIRQKVKEVGEHLKKWDQATGLDNKGKREVPFLIIEVDGVMLKKQKRNRKKEDKKERRFEVKTAVIHEGWEKKNKKEAKLKNPTYFVYTGDGKEFWQVLERKLSRTYDLEGIKRIIIGGDGADWVSYGVEIIGGEYQYCRFHLSKELRQVFGQQDQLRKTIKKIIEENEREKFNIILKALQVEEKDPKQKEKLKHFQILINSVWEGIIDWRKRGKKVPEGARGLGVIEANAGHTVARRCKHIGASWSEEGADCVTRVRCAKRNGELKEYMSLPAPLSKDFTNKKTIQPQVTNGYWARKETEGIKGSSFEWCQRTMPAQRGSKQTMREFAYLITRLEKDWLLGI